MVKASELRIRNWVNEPVLGNVLVDGVSPFVAYLKKKYDSFHYSINYENVFPIPLTHDILLKCGFYKWDDHKFNYEGFMDYWSVTILPDGDCEIYYSAYKGETGRIICHVKYLHQLQNLYFALTGEELKIEL